MLKLQSLISNPRHAVRAWSAPLLLCGSLAVVLYLLIFPLQDYDTFWHLAYGRAMVESGQFINNEIYSYTAAGAPLGSHSQLAQVLLYLVYVGGGATGLIVFKCLVGSTTLLLLYGVARRIGAGPVVSVSLGILVVAAGIDRFVERPELFSILCVASLMYLLFGFSRGVLPVRVLWLLPPMFAAWEFLHGSLYGLTLLAAFVAAETGKFFVPAKFPGKFPRTTPLSSERMRALWLWSTVVLVVLLVHPNGFLSAGGILDAILRLHSQSADYAMYGEWAAPSFKRQFLLYWAFLACSCVLSIVAWRRIDPSALCVALPFVVLSLKYGRANLFFCMAAVPLLAQGVVHIASGVESRARKIFDVLSLCLIVVIFTGVMLFKAYFVADVFRFGTGINQDVFPVGSTRFVKDVGLSGNLYNMDGYGGYLAYHLGPERKIFHYNQPGVFTALTDFVHKPESRSRWDIRYAIIGKSEEYDMFMREGFVPVYWEPTGMVLVRPDAGMQPIIDRYAIKYFQPLLDNGELSRRAARPWAVERLLREMATYLAYRRDDRVAELFAEICRASALYVPAPQRMALAELASRGNPGNPGLSSLQGLLNADAGRGNGEER